MIIEDNVEKKDSTNEDIPLNNDRCPLCHGKLKLYQTKKGMMIGCLNYPRCKFIRSYNHQGVEVKKVTTAKCPLCGDFLAVKSGRFGYFIGCMNFPECQYIHKEEEEPIHCPDCGEPLQMRKTKYNKVFWGCMGYPKCSFITHFKPISKKCKDCGYALLYEKKDKNGKFLFCPICKHRKYF